MNRILPFLLGVLLPIAAFGQTAPGQVEKFFGPSLGKQWKDVLADHPRTSGTAPAATVCGTAPAVLGTDTAGQVTMGTGTPTGCVLTFATPYVAAPFCVVSWQNDIADMQYTVTTTALTLVQTATDSNIVNWICVARSGG